MKIAVIQFGLIRNLSITIINNKEFFTGIGKRV